MTYLPSMTMPTATANAPGLVQPDGATITVVGGVISAVGTGVLPSQAVTVGSASQMLAFAAGARETSVAVTLARSCVLTIGASPAGSDQIMTIDLIQSGAGGFVPSFSNVSWAGGIAPLFNTAPTKRDTIQVRAVGGDVMGWPVSMGRAPMMPGVPAAPASITVSSGVLQATINAASVAAYPAVTGYNVYAGASSGAQGSVPIASNVALPYVETGLPAGVARFYKVAAVNSAGEGAWSAEAVATPVAAGTIPAAPASITVSAGGMQNVVSASAVAASPAVTGYTIRRGTVAGGEAATPVATNVSLPWVDSAVVAGTTYFYVVSAVNGLGTGPASPEGSGTPVQAAHYASFMAADSVIYTSPSAALNPGSAGFEMQAKVRMASWATGGAVETNLFGCWDVTVAKRLWRLGVTTDGRLRASWATGASTSVTAVSSVAIGAAGGTDLWVRAVVVPTTGSVTFYTSVDGSTWAALGSGQAATGSGSVYTPSTLPYLVIGCNASAAAGPAAEQFLGRFYEARLFINATLVTDPVAGASGTTDSQGFAYSTSVATYV